MIRAVKRCSKSIRFGGKRFQDGDVMSDNYCICCGKIIPEGRQVCLSCGDYDDMQTFKKKKEEKMMQDFKDLIELLRQKDDEVIM